MKKRISMLLVVVLILTYALVSSDTNEVFAKSKKSVSSVIEKMENKEAVKIVCYGDSITWGVAGKDTRSPYSKELERLLREKYGYEEITVCNYGFPGRQSDELASKQYISKVKAEKADLVILMCGINDCRGSFKGGSPLTATQYKQNLKSISTTLSSSALVIMTPTYFQPKKDIEQTELKYSKFVQAAKSVAKTQGVSMIDLNRLVDNDVTDNYSGDYSQIQVDGVHFISDYYNTIALFISENLEN